MTTTDGFLSLGFAAVDWIEHYLVHGPGDVQGLPIELDDEMAAFIVKAYRLSVVGDRRVRRAFLSRAKGRNKSGVAAMIACFEALGPCRFDHWAVPGEVSDWGYEYEPGEPVGRALGYVEILNVATEEGQAGNTYDAIYYMLNPETCSEALLVDYGRIDVGLTRTNLPNRRGFIEPVTSADTSKDGGKSTFIVADETHLWILPRLARLHGVMTRNLLKRKVASGWMLETSTMYAAGEGSVAEGTHDYAKRRKGDPALLFDHVQAADKYDLNDRAQRVTALREAYGPASAWMNLEAIADSWDDPQVSEGEFRRYWLNQPVALVEKPKPDFPVDEWANLVDPNAEMTRVACFAISVSPDRAWASIGAAGPTVSAGSRPLVELIVHRSGTTGLLQLCRELRQKHGRRVPFAVNDHGPAKSLVTELGDAGITVIALNGSNVADATEGFLDAIAAKAVVHGPQSEIDDAMLAAPLKLIGDGRRAIAIKEETLDVTALEAVMFALWGAARPKPRTRVVSLSDALLKESSRGPAVAEEGRSHSDHRPHGV